MLEIIKTFIVQNPDLATLAIALFLALQAALIPLSGILQCLGLTTAARIVGFAANIDLSGIVAWLQGKIAKVKARSAEAAELASKVTAMALISVALLAMQACQAFAKGVDTAQNVCETKLAVLPEVVQEAQLRGVTVGQLVAGFCGLVDVAAIFTESKPSGARLAAQKPEAQALALLRAKGEVQ